MRRRSTAPWICVGALVLLLGGCMSQKEWAALLDGPYPLNLDYSRSVEESLQAGKYDWVYYRITPATFASSETGKADLTAVLVRFSPQADLDWLFRIQAAAGYRPSTFKELLAFGEAYPEVQRKLPVIALGSPADLQVTVFLQDYRQDWGLPLTQITQRTETVYPILWQAAGRRIVNFDWLADNGSPAVYYACFVKKG